jgi:hypothetical protein
LLKIRWEGCKSISELRPDVVALGRELRRQRPKPTRRAIATELAARGHLASSGKPFEPICRGADAARLIANCAAMPRDGALIINTPLWEGHRGQGLEISHEGVAGVLRAVAPAS